MENIINNFDFSHIYNFTVWMVLVYAAVTFAMVLDLITGVRKAKMLGIATRSRLFKKTCDKAIKYFLPMMCLAMVDIIGSLILPCPVFTMLMAAFNVFCEFKSIMESTHEKKEIQEAAETMSVIIKNKDDISEIVKIAMEELLKQKDEK